jgi:glucose dehydrogenase|tara:strand:+ start:2736 stop:2993 length:258 start_codon:yes stop_codon:yes gene_type:complete
VNNSASSLVAARRQFTEDVTVQGWIDDPYLWAFDPEDGEVVGRFELPGNARGAPSTYLVEGKQFIVVPIGGFFRAAEWVALSLPD